MRYYVGSIPYGDDELRHYGIPGMKWGVRRYQNPDGTLTAEGKVRYGDGGGAKTSKFKETAAKVGTAAKNVATKIGTYAKDRAVKKAKDVHEKRHLRDLSDEELKARVDRLQLEKRYRDLAAEAAPKSKGREYITKMFDSLGQASINIVTNSITNLGTQATTHWLGDKLNEYLGNKEKDNKRLDQEMLNRWEDKQRAKYTPKHGERRRRRPVYDYDPEPYVNPKKGQKDK